MMDSKYQVQNYIDYKIGESNIILGKIGRKVIVNPYGLIKINSGNHSAEHIAFIKKIKLETIHIYHYPIRSYLQFEKNIQNRKYLLENFSNVKMGKHYKRWVKLYNEGKLEEEYKKFLFEDKEIGFLKKIGILVENDIPSKILKEFM